MIPQTILENGHFQILNKRNGKNFAIKQKSVTDFGKGWFPPHPFILQIY